MNVEQHFLVVPEDLGQPMEIEHPLDCRQRGHLELVREEDGTVACLVEQLARIGPETWFRREPEPHPFFPDTVQVLPGRYPVEAWLAGPGADWSALGGLALVADAAAGDGAA